MSRFMLPIDRCVGLPLYSKENASSSYMDKKSELVPFVVTLLVFDNGRRPLSAESQSETADEMLRSQCTKIENTERPVGLVSYRYVVARGPLLACLQQRERGLSWCANPSKVKTRVTLYGSELLATVGSMLPSVRWFKVAATTVLL